MALFARKYGTKEEIAGGIAKLIGTPLGEVIERQRDNLVTRLMRKAGRMFDRHVTQPFDNCLFEKDNVYTALGTAAGGVAGYLLGTWFADYVYSSMESTPGLAHDNAHMAAALAGTGAALLGTFGGSLAAYLNKERIAGWVGNTLDSVSGVWDNGMQYLKYAARTAAVAGTLAGAFAGTMVVNNFWKGDPVKAGHTEEAAAPARESPAEPAASSKEMATSVKPAEARIEKRERAPYKPVFAPREEWARIKPYDVVGRWSGGVSVAQRAIISGDAEDVCYKIGDDPFLCTDIGDPITIDKPGELQVAVRNSRGEIAASYRSMITREMIPQVNDAFESADKEEGGLVAGGDGVPAGDVIAGLVDDFFSFMNPACLRPARAG